MEFVMDNEFEMREIFNELNSQNQMKLIIRARQIQTTQKEKKNEKAFRDGNIGLYADIRSKGSICPDGTS